MDEKEIQDGRGVILIGMKSRTWLSVMRFKNVGGV